MDFNFGGGGISIEAPDLGDCGVLEAEVDLVEQLEAVPGTTHLRIIYQQPILDGQHIKRL